MKARCSLFACALAAALFGCGDRDTYRDTTPVTNQSTGTAVDPQDPNDMDRAARPGAGQTRSPSGVTGTGQYDETSPDMGGGADVGTPTDTSGTGATGTGTSGTGTPPPSGTGTGTSGTGTPDPSGTGTSGTSPDTSGTSIDPPSTTTDDTSGTTDDTSGTSDPNTDSTKNKKKKRDTSGSDTEQNR